MTAVLEFLAQRKKAIAGFVSPGVALFVTYWVHDGALPTFHEWESIGIACALTAVGVHSAPKNKARV